MSTLPQENPTRIRFGVMAFLCILSFLTYYDRVCIVRAQEDVQSSLHISNEQMGLIFGAFWLAYALFEIPGGLMGDRFGARFTLTRVVLAWSLFTALSGSATGFLSLLLYRFLFGVGEAGAYPCMARIQSRWLPARSRARAGGLLWLMARWGGAFSPFIFGSLLRGLKSDDVQHFLQRTNVLAPLAHVAPWRMAFWISGLLGVVWVLFFYPWFRDNPADKPAVNAAEMDLINADRPDQEERHAIGGVLGSLLRSPSLWAMAFLYVFASFGWSFFVSWLPKFLKDVHHLSMEKSELRSGLPLFLGGISCLVGGYLSDFMVKKTGRRRLGRAIFPVAGYLTAAVAMLAIPFVKNQNQAVIVVTIAAGAFDFGQGANWATIVDIGGRYAGTAAGFINMIGNMGNSIQPYIGALIFGHFGWNTLFVVYAAAFLAAATMWVFIDPTRSFHPSDRPAPGFPVTHPIASAGK
jgi:MFS family permease